MSRTEQPRYTIVESQQAIELRDYAPMIVAETEVAGSREAAINAGFRILADYIFGNNQAAQRVPMTAPVFQQTSEKIPMTAPVMQQARQGAWRVRFVMPSRFTLETLPKPNSPAVTVREEPGRRLAVIRFSGRPVADQLKEQTGELMAFIESRSLHAAGEPVYAFYDPPWTLPFLRRNEVMVEITR